MNILIENAYIITADEQNTVHESGFIGIKDGKISSVSDKKPEDFRADKVINANGNLIMPGLINAHTHTAMTLLRSYAEGYSLQDWLNQKIFPIEDKLTAEDIFWGTKLGILEGLRFGTTAVSDCYYFMDRAADAYLEIGMKANISRGLMLIEDSGTYTSDYRIAEALKCFEDYDDREDGLIKTELFPHAVYTCPFGYLKYIADIAKEKNLRISSHLAENKTEFDFCMEKYGKTPAMVYYEAGLFRDGANMAHCVYLTDEDLPLMKNLCIAHNPTSNLKLGSGIADIRKYSEAGITVALGTDGASSNNNLSVLKEMQTAALLQSFKSGPETADSSAFIKMATVNGARALGREDCGMLKPGKDADLIMLSRSEIYNYPVINPVNNLIYANCGSDVVMTMIRGKALYENGRFTTCDAEEVIRKCEEIKKRIYS